MYGVNALGFRKRNDPRNIEIRLDRPLALTDRIRFIRFEPVQRQPVLFRIHRHGPQTQFVRRTEYPYSDLTAIRRHQFSNGLALMHGSLCARRGSRTFFHAGWLALQQFF